LQARVQADIPFAGVWRRRLALKAAVASVQIKRRRENEAALRDAFLMRRSGDEIGPSGRLLLAWRALDRSSPLDDDAVAHVLNLLEIKEDDALRGAIAGAQKLVTYNRPAPVAAAQAASLVFTVRPKAEVFALWLADTVLAVRLKWPMPLPLLAPALLHSSLRTAGCRACPGDGNWTEKCWAAYARAAIEACDLFAELQPRSQKLLAVAPELRSKQAAAVIELLHNEDAVLPAWLQRAVKISKWSAHRICDRLVDLDALRVLTDRPHSPQYGM
jgi:Protein of unknown function (DUF1403)